MVCLQTCSGVTYIFPCSSPQNIEHIKSKKVTERKRYTILYGGVHQSTGAVIQQTPATGKYVFFSVICLLMRVYFECATIAIILLTSFSRVRQVHDKYDPPLWSYGPLSLLKLKKYPLINPEIHKSVCQLSIKFLHSHLYAVVSIL